MGSEGAMRQAKKEMGREGIEGREARCERGGGRWTFGRNDTVLASFLFVCARNDRLLASFRVLDENWD